MIRTAKFRGVKYRVKFTDKLPAKEWAAIDDPEYDSPTMLIHKEAAGKMLFDCEVHEALHAIYPYLSEDEIDSGATELVTYLVRRGYKLCNCKGQTGGQDDIKRRASRCENSGEEDGVQASDGDGGLALREHLRADAPELALEPPEKRGRIPQAQGKEPQGPVESVGERGDKA
jgi:hypothetical protein